MTESAHHPVFVSSDAARAVFVWKEGVGAIQAAYGRKIDGIAAPPRTVAREGGAWLRMLPAMPPGGRYFGAKLMGMAAGSATPGCEYVIVLFDRETSRIAAFIDAHMITAFRTAATSAAAVDRLISAEPVRLAVIGSGLEAMMHTRAFASIRPLAQLSVFSPNPDRRASFATAVATELGVPAFAASTPQEATAGASLVLAAARSHGEQPILYGDWIEAGAAVVSIGSTVPSQREIDVSVVARSDLIVCDMVEEVIEQTGDMIAASQAGIDFHAKTFGLADLMAGALDAHAKAAVSPMFKSVGGGVQDIVIAELILTKALEAGLTTPLPIEFEIKR